VVVIRALARLNKGGSLMYGIWIKCPATGRRASTGIESDSPKLEHVLDQLNAIRCPSCGMHHRWLKEDAWLVTNKKLELT
jgi:hypothetical protein